MERHWLATGLFIILDEPTAPMREEAATAGGHHDVVEHGVASARVQR